MLNLVERIELFRTLEEDVIVSFHARNVVLLAARAV